MESKEFELQVMDNRIKDLMEENIYLKGKIAFSLGALEGISYLLKNEDPLLIEKHKDHLKNTVNRVLDDLRKTDI